jgi:hypothetical protein
MRSPLFITFANRRTEGVAIAAACRKSNARSGVRAVAMCPFSRPFRACRTADSHARDSTAAPCDDGNRTASRSCRTLILRPCEPPDTERVHSSEPHADSTQYRSQAFPDAHERPPCGSGPVTSSRHAPLFAQFTRRSHKPTRVGLRVRGERRHPLARAAPFRRAARGCYPSARSVARDFGANTTSRVP